MNDRSDLMAHLAEEIALGNITAQEANVFAGIPTPVDLIPLMPDNDLINGCYEEYASVGC